MGSRLPFLGSLGPASQQRSPGEGDRGQGGSEPGGNHWEMQEAWRPGPTARGNKREQVKATRLWVAKPEPRPP